MEPEPREVRLFSGAYGRGHLDDFSFASAEAATAKLVADVGGRTLSGDHIEAGKALCAEIEAIGRYLGFYNSGRPHSSHGGQTPDEVYFDQPLLAAA